MDSAHSLIDDIKALAEYKEDKVVEEIKERINRVENALESQIIEGLVEAFDIVESAEDI